MGEMEFFTTVQTKDTLTIQVNHPAGTPLAEVDTAVLEYVLLYKPEGDGAEFEVSESKRRGHWSDAATVGSTVRLRRKGTKPTKKRPYKAPIC